MAIDVEKLIGSLDEDTLRKLQEALNARPNSESKEEIHEDKVEEESTDNNGNIVKSTRIEPYKFFITITPDQWEFNGDNWVHKREVYTDKYQLRESGILNMYVDEEAMTKELEGDELKSMNEFIDYICNNGLVRIKSENIIGTLIYMGKEKPTKNISVVVEELPFPDCPASSLGF